MKVYAVCIPEMRTVYHDMEPPETFMPVGLFVAESNAHARSLAFGTWASQLHSGVDIDDFINLRARVIDWEGGWDDGEFWHALEVGEVTNSTHPYVQALWNCWPKEYVAR